jgi:UDP-glucose 4-epimerase
MTVLVTGGAGYIGSHMILELLDHHEKVVVVDNLSTGFASAVPREAELVVGDFGDNALITRLIEKHRVNAVVHFAALIVVPESVAKPLQYYRNNTVNAHRLISTVIEARVPHFIFSSTAAVYGTPDVSPVPEDAPLKPESPYGRSKMMVEMMLADAAAAHPHLRYVALRYFNVAGADPKGRAGQSTAGATHLIKVAAETALGKRGSLTVFGTDYPTPDGTCIRDYIHVTDLCDAHTAALRHLRQGGKNDVFNVGYGRGLSVLDVVKAVKRISGRDFKVVFGPRRPGDPASIVASPATLKAALGWKPRHDSIDEIVTTALAWEAKLGTARAMESPARAELVEPAPKTRTGG